MVLFSHKKRVPFLTESSMITERLRGALKAVAEGAAHDVAAEEFNVPEYEISYVIGNLSRKKNILDTHVANVGED